MDQEVDTGIPAVGRRAARAGAARAGAAFLPAAYLCLFLAYPLARILDMGLRPVLQSGLRALGELAAQSLALPLLVSSGSQALASTALSLAVGLPAAYVFARLDFPGKRVLRVLMGIPFVLPTVVVASAFTALIGPGGVLERLAGREIGLMRTLGAVLLAHVFYNVSIVVRIVGGLWANLDPRLRPAAQVLGAGRARSFLAVTARLLLPAAAAAAALVFSYCFTSFGVILMLGGPRISTLETEIYRQAAYMFNLPAAAFLSVVQLLFTIMVMAGYSRLQAAMSVTMQLAPSSVTSRRPQGAGQWALVCVFGVGLTAALLAPLAVLAAGSVMTRSGFSLDAWALLFRNVTGSLFWVSPLAALGNSLVFAAASVVLSLLVGIPAAAAISRVGRGKGTAGRGFLDVLFLVPLGTSAVTLGFGFIISFGSPPLDLRGSLLLMPIAHSLVALPLVTRSIMAPLGSLDPRLRQAAWTLGASPARARWEVDVPMLRRAVRSAAAFAFTVSLGEFAATALLARPESATLPVAVYRALLRPGEASQGQAMAMSTILMAVCALGLAAIEHKRARRTEVF
jgi:thiamine transport system permease protein